MMEKIACNTGIYPEYIMATTQDSTTVWPGYEKIPNLTGGCGGLNCRCRMLYKREF